MNAAGCLIEPPVSVPVAAMHKSADTAEEDPPEEPPGVSQSSISLLFQGFTAGP